MASIKFLNNEKYAMLSSIDIRIRDFPAAFYACWASLQIYFNKVLINTQSGSLLMLNTKIQANNRTK